ncbi:MAG TPA: recombinase family protein [Anaeromyxobacter sp.]
MSACPRGKGGRPLLSAPLGRGLTPPGAGGRAASRAGRGAPRPAFQRLLGLLRDPAPPPFDAVLVDDDSRLDRGGVLAQLAGTFRARGVRLISVDSGPDLTQEDPRLLNHVRAAMNEENIYELSRRTRAGLASKVLHGFHAGARTYGYRLVPEWPEGLPPEKRDRENRIGTRVEIDEAQAAIVRRIFDEYSRGAGFRDIAHQLNREGVPSSRGKPSWDRSGVRTILLNPRYVGGWSWSRRRWEKTPEALLSEAERERARRTGRHPRRPVMRAEEDLVRRHDEELRIIPDAL